MKKRCIALLLSGSLVLSGAIPAVGCAAAPAIVISSPVEGTENLSAAEEPEGSSFAEEAEDSSFAEEIAESSVTEEIEEAFASAEEESAQAAAKTEEGLAWTSDLALGITREHELMKAAGLSLDEWDQAVSDAKNEGLRNALTEAALKAEAPEAEILKKDGRVYMIHGSSAFAPVQDAISAYRTLYQVMNLLGGTKDTDMRLWSLLTMKNLAVYSFQEFADGEEVLGSAVKIAVNEDGSLSAIFSGLDTETVNSAPLASRTEIEEAVRRHLHGEGIQADPISDKTERINYLPVGMDYALNLDLDPDPVPVEILWVVYTENAPGSEYPYTAHYTDINGTYRFSLDVKEPGDGESRTGYRKQQVFEGMTPDEWSGEICDMEGNVRYVTLPVMHSENDGRWYLGDVTRRIAIADFAEAAYGEEHRLDLVGMDTNSGWDNEDLYVYYNYLRAWDFYRTMGWDGPDGEGTDVIILKSMCTSSGELFENACSIGMIENWSMFGYTPYLEDGTPFGLTQALDVMIHEFTHTFTTTVMNNNLYENDLGAINEAMSDIFGNLGEFLYHDTEDMEWKLGENGGIVVRSMSRPHDYEQPEYVWDVFYGPHVDEITTVNDNGGVHSNSSLLSRIAALLCIDYGMSYEEAVPFWVTVAYGLTPETDYREMGALLNWALKISGNEAYSEGLNKLIEEEDLSRTELPEELPEGRKIVRLQLPDNDVFRDENWGLISLQVNRKALEALGRAAVKISRLGFKGEAENYAAYGPILAGISEELGLGIDESLFADISTGEEAAEVIQIVLEEIRGKLVIQTMTWEEDDTGEMVMVSEDNPAIYTLLNATESGTKVRGCVILIGKRWYDLGGVMEMAENVQDGSVEVAPETVEELADFIMEVIGDIIADKKAENGEEGSFLDSLVGAVEFVGRLLSEDDAQIDEGISSAVDELLTAPAETEYLPTEGLEKVQLAG